MNEIKSEVYSWAAETSQSMLLLKSVRRGLSVENVQST